MLFNGQQESFQELLEIVISNERRVVPFIGAGLSIYGEESERLPTWSSLVLELLNRGKHNGTVSENVFSEIIGLQEQGEYIRATDLLVNSLGEANFRIFLQRLLNTDQRSLPPAIARMVCIAWSLIVTTNLDQFIERAWEERYGKQINMLTHQNIHQLASVVSGQSKSPATTLIKLHGTVETYESWILSGNQYQLLLNRSDYLFALRNLFTKTIFFVGYSLSDVELTLLLTQLKTLFPGGIGSYFALLDSRRKGSSTIITIIREFGVQPIWYEFNPEEKDSPNSGHGQVTECLQLLASAWLGSRKKNNALLRFFPELEPGFIGREAELEVIANRILAGNNIQVIGFGGEGKTSMVQYLVQKHPSSALISEKFDKVFGFSFYAGDVGKFINDACTYFGIGSHFLGIPDKVRALCTKLSVSRYLIVLDGLETELNINGDIKNQYLEKVIQTCLNGQAQLLITTRIPVNVRVPVYNLGPLSEKDTSALLKKWNIDAENYHIRRYVREHVGRHALSLRVLAGFISDSSLDTLELIEKVSFQEIKDEADPLKANKVARMLSHYLDVLDPENVAFMKCFTIFYNPVKVDLVLDCLGANLGNNALNSPLVGKELRSVIRKLLELRLLILEDENQITSHPTVRDFFSAGIPDETFYPLHDQVATFYRRELCDQIPETFENAFEYFSLCYHLAKAKRWKLFDYYYRTIINRNQIFFLGYSIAAWEENIYLAKMVFPNGDVSGQPAINPIYYHSSLARSYNHLGQYKEAKLHFRACLNLCISEGREETTRYLNNLLTLQIATGDLLNGYELISANLLTLRWVEDQEFFLWQKEHALFSAGYLSNLLGHSLAAERCFSLALNTYTNPDRKWHYFTHRLFYVDYALESNSSLGLITWIEESLQTAKKNKWVGTEIMCYRSLSMYYRFQNEPAEIAFSKVLPMIRKGIDLTLQHYVPRFEVEIWLEWFRWQTTLIQTNFNQIDMVSFEDNLEKLGSLVVNTGQLLHQSEILALKGWKAYLSNQQELAKSYCKKAIDLAQSQSHVHLLKAKLKSLHPLISVLELTSEAFAKNKAPVIELIPEDFLGRDVSTDEISQILEACT